MQKSTCFLHLNLSCLMSQVSSRHPCRHNNYLLWHLIDGLLMKKWILPVCLGVVKDEQFKDIIMTTGVYMLFQNLILDLCFLLSNLLLTFCFKKICFRVITLSLCIKILIMPAVYMLIVTWSKTFKWQTDSLRHTSFLITPFQHSLEGFITPPLATCLLTTILWELPPPRKTRYLVTWEWRATCRSVSWLSCSGPCVHSSVYAEDAIPGDHQECLFFDLPSLWENQLWNYRWEKLFQSRRLVQMDV